MNNYVVRKIYEDNNGLEHEDLFFCFDNSFKPTSEDLDCLYMVEELLDIYNENFNKQDMIEIRSMNSEVLRKDIEEIYLKEGNNIAQGSSKDFLKHFIKVHFKDRIKEENKNISFTQIAQEIIKEHDIKKNTR